MNENVPQLATIKIVCNGTSGSAILFFPDENADEVYIFTAKHCLSGKKFDKNFKKEDILLDKIFNSNDKTYHSYRLADTDIVLTSDNTTDLALLVLPKQCIVELTGRDFYMQVADTNTSINDYIIRGFADFNDQKEDRNFSLKYTEDLKDDKRQFLLKSEQQLDTYYQQALENVEGLSGCGAYSILSKNTYLTGIIHSYEDPGLFKASKIIAYNQLIPFDKYKIAPIKPETNDAIIKSFVEMDRNLEAANQRTRDTIGNLNIPRETKTLSTDLKTSPLTVIHGKPGVGKSAIAKAALTEMRANSETTVITFTAEQMYSNTVNEALTKAGYTASIEEIIGSPLSGNRVLIWIESLEKLIEAGYEGAFNELLILAKKHRQLSMVVTMRDYLLQKFKIIYQFELPEYVTFFSVEEFNDEEVDKVREAIPALAPLLDNEKVNHLLRTAYYLDKAARIIPELVGEPILDEERFKKLMWNHIIEVGKPIRGNLFAEICLKRAREMSLFTSSDLSEEIIQGLVADNILQKDDSELSDGYAPSHDILEDWALIRFIKKLKRDSPNSKKFLENLETKPAIRRAFRLWLDEFYKLHPIASANFAYELITDHEVSQAWKDELIITSLRSNHAQPLFTALKTKLLENNGSFLRQVINLLQTGCKTIDPNSNNFDRLLPLGSGWEFIIDFIKTNFQTIKDFTNFEFQYMSLMEAWSKQLPEFNPRTMPPAAPSIAYLISELIQKYQNVSNDYGQRKGINFITKQYLPILFKITGATSDLMRELVNAALDPETPHIIWTNKTILYAVRNYMVYGVTSDQFCKYFPNEVFRIATEEWQPKKRETRSRSLMGIDEQSYINNFGLDKRIDSDYKSPSGYQTFFYWMLFYHPQSAIEFVISFLNKAFQKNCDAHVKSGKRMEEIRLNFPNGLCQTYFSSREYWEMYRGFQSRSRIITSLLMALETGLLDLVDNCETNFEQIKYLLFRMITESNNVAVLGLATSIIKSCPALLDENTIPIFSIPNFYKWDGSSYSSEMINFGNYNDNHFEKSERIRSDQRAHRRKYHLGMVGFVRDYLFYHRTHNVLLCKVIDDMWAILPQEDLLWKKYLYDMDARKYDLQPIEQPGYENMLQLVPGYDQEINKKIIIPSDDFARVPKGNAAWSHKTFEYEDVKDKNYETWKAGYEFIKSLKGKSHIMVSPATMAAIGLRDFADELTDDEINWCEKELIHSGARLIKKEDSSYASLSILDVNPSMVGLSFIFKKNANSTNEQQAKEIIFRLLLSSIEERSKIYLDHGISFYLAKYQPAFVTDCWYGLLSYIDYQKANEEKDISHFTLSFAERKKIDENNRKREKSWINRLVKKVLDGTISHDVKTKQSLVKKKQWHQNDALRIIPANTSLSAQREFIQQLLDLHAKYLNDPSNIHTYDDHSESRHAFTFFYARYLLNQPAENAKILFKELLCLTLPTQGQNNSEKFEKFLYNVIKEHILAVNDGAPKENFWKLWEDLRDWIIENNNPFLIPLFLIDLDWTENSQDWRVLEGKSLLYKDFIGDYGYIKINVSIKFLNGIAFNKFMPDSLSWIASMLTAPNAWEIDPNLASKFTEKAFYKYGRAIKSDKKLLNDFLAILDFLVTKQSSKAYMLREELIQYKR